MDNEDHTLAEKLARCSAFVRGIEAAEAAELGALLKDAELLREALTELRDRIKAHPAYENLTEDEELETGGDTAEFSYLARVADEALGGAKR